MTLLLLRRRDADLQVLAVGERHNLDDQAGPAGEVLGALALARFRVVLLPREARLLPALVDGLDQVLAELSVQLCGALRVRAGGLGGVLEECGSARYEFYSEDVADRECGRGKREKRTNKRETTR